MGSRKPQGETPYDTGPFRKMEHPDESENLEFEDAIAVKKMKKKIETEKKFGIRLAEDIKTYDRVPLFEEALESNVEPKDIVLYSLATGILRYTGDEVFSPKAKSFYFSNPNEPSVTLDIYVNKNSKELPYPHVFSLTNKAKVENDKKLNQEMKKEDLVNPPEKTEKSLPAINDDLKPKKPNTIK